MVAAGNHKTDALKLGQANCEFPDLIFGCDLLAYRVLEEVSSEIVGNCRAFGSQLEGVCGKALKRLPGSTGEEADGDQPTAFDCADACLGFITAFASLSTALLALAGDLESAVTHPLKHAIATLTEESTGRAKHLQQVRLRFAQLQERYCKTRQRTVETKGKLAADSEKRWSWGRSQHVEAASAQHAAMCELARCQEELLESEASLRKLEDDNRERLKQLDKEKKAILRGALLRGTSSLRRLLPVADKVPPPEEWQAVLPSSAGHCVTETSSNTAVADKHLADSPSDGGTSRETVCTPQKSLQQGAFDLEDFSDVHLSQVDAAAASDDRSLRYLQSHESLPDADEESEEEVDIAVRAAGWSPGTSSSSQPSRRKTLVFQSPGDTFIRKDNLFVSSTSSSPNPCRSICSQDSKAGDCDFQVGVKKLPDELSGVSNLPSTPQAKTSCNSSPPRVKESISDSEDDSDDDLTRPRRRNKAPLESPPVSMQFSPVVAEQPQSSFERYVKRLSERMAAVGETNWERLQEKASEQALGGLVGKLEIFWIHRSGGMPTPESADGLVCFQFVQGHASNHARVLHLSVVANGPDCWHDVLPSAIFEVRRLIFETMAVDSIRAVILASEDDDGLIYVDRDVEAAYQVCRFRWFQLTQSIRRSRSAIRKSKVRGSTRFLILHVPRTTADPVAPRSHIGSKPALVLKNNPSDEVAPCAVTKDAALQDVAFKSW